MGILKRLVRVIRSTQNDHLLVLGAVAIWVALMVIYPLLHSPPPFRLCDPPPC